MNNEISAVMDRMTHGVYLIGVKTSQCTNGMTAAWVTQVSRTPPMVLVAIGKTHYTSQLIPEAGCFSVNVLRTDQFDLAKKCGFGSGRDKNRLADVPLIYQTTGAPILADCAAYLDCRLTYAFDVGTCLLFVGEVVRAADSGDPTLAYDVKRFFGRD